LACAVARPTAGPWGNHRGRSPHATVRPDLELVCGEWGRSTLAAVHQPPFLMPGGTPETPARARLWRGGGRRIDACGGACVQTTPSVRWRVGTPPAPVVGGSLTRRRLVPVLYEGPTSRSVSEASSLRVNDDATTPERCMRRHDDASTPWHCHRGGACVETARGCILPSVQGGRCDRARQTGTQHAKGHIGGAARVAVHASVCDVSHYLCKGQSRAQYV